MSGCNKRKNRSMNCASHGPIRRASRSPRADNQLTEKRFFTAQNTVNNTPTPFPDKSTSANHTRRARERVPCYGLPHTAPTVNYRSAWKRFRRDCHLLRAILGAWRLAPVVPDAARSSHIFSPARIFTNSFIQAYHVQLTFWKRSGVKFHALTALRGNVASNSRDSSFAGNFVRSSEKAAGRIMGNSHPGNKVLFRAQVAGGAGLNVQWGISTCGA